MKDMKSKCMTVRELIEFLQDFDDELPIVYIGSDDPERCYFPLTKKQVSVEYVCTDMENAVEFQALTIGEDNFR